MAYRRSFNYKGGPRKERKEKGVKKGLKTAGWIVLWLLIGTFLAHLIYSVVVRTKKGLDELSSEGIPPIETIQDAVNSKGEDVLSIGAPTADSYEADKYISLLVRKGVKAVLIDVKPESGVLNYTSESKTAVKLAASPEGAPELQRFMLKFQNVGIKVAARLSLYADNLAAAVPEHAAVETDSVEKVVTNEQGNELPAVDIKPSDRVWKDKSGGFWLNPYDSLAVDYAKELMEELSEAGVYAVLFDNVLFPSEDDGNVDGVFFRGETESGLPRSAAVKQNVSILYSAAQSLGLELWLGVDASTCGGAEDKVAGMTFNPFELKADALCPSVLLSDIEKSGVRQIGEYEFESTASADLAKLMEGFVETTVVLQGAYENPPRVMPFIQAYTDKSLPTSRRRDVTAEELRTMRRALDGKLVTGRVIVGDRESYEAVLPDLPEKNSESSESSEAEKETKK